MKHSKYADIIERICDWSQQTEEVEGAIVIGSQTRDVLLADQWSDLDLMVLVRAPDTFLKGRQWLNRFGKVVCAFNDQTDAIETLGHLIDVTRFISQELCETSGYEFDPDQFTMIRKLYCAMKEPMR